MELPGRDVRPDIKHNSVLISKLINYVMHDGKKSVAERVVYDSLQEIEQRSEEPALEVFNSAISNCSPRLEVRTRRVGGANYQVPYEVPANRQLALALRWIVAAARDRAEHTMAHRLAAEILEAARKEGRAYNKRLDSHRMAEANRAFAHYRW
ncbi:MAG: 30S ribosomal protein S7 [Candidatus Bipolaricaulota bacterium]|nr:MAG: 30S ribosomal protein S7 [Candidatus Bipolaricaulota bacterium]